MALPPTKDRPVYVSKMMERIGIEAGGGVVPSLGLLHATASHRCESCLWTRACRDWLDHAPATMSFASPFFRNNDILSELQLRNMISCPHAKA
jgi:hypothetical protein